MGIEFHPSILEKLADKHGVTPEEVRECFANRDGGFLIDTNENHRTNPPTQWFVAKTDRGRELKICFMRFGRTVQVKTAFEAGPKAKRIYAEKK